jgi:hypothetical protein
MDFQERLAKAIERGQQFGQQEAQAKHQDALSEEDLRRLHSKYRLPLTERIEACLKRLPDHFPGFQFSTLMSDRGWGATVSRDDVGAGRTTFFSRLELVVRPFSAAHVLELSAKGTIRNKEIYNRTQYQRLTEADPEMFANMIDLWVLEYAELYAAKS